MVPVCSSVMLELVLTVHSYHVIAYPVISPSMKRFFAKMDNQAMMSFTPAFSTMDYFFYTIAQQFGQVFFFYNHLIYRHGGL